jgi:hypothetical protein
MPMLTAWWPELCTVEFVSAKPHDEDPPPEPVAPNLIPAEDG